MPTPNQDPIPRIMHQIWIGPDPVPHKLMGTWRDKHPDWKHCLWREAHIDTMKMSDRARELVDAYITDERYCGAANVMRAYILYRHGGVYIDADMECLYPLDEADFMDDSCWISQSPHDGNRTQNAAMGCSKYNPVMAAYCEALSQVEVHKRHPSWVNTGAVLFDTVRKSLPHETVAVVPSPAFHPYTKSGTLNKMSGGYHGVRYAKHYFYTSHGRTMTLE